MALKLNKYFIFDLPLLKYPAAEKGRQSIRYPVRKVGKKTRSHRNKHFIEYQIGREDDLKSRKKKENKKIQYNLITYVLMDSDMENG